MTKEDKELLLKDLCGRLPYNVKVNIKSYDKPVTLQCITNNNSSYFKIEEIGYDFRTWEEDIKPYLRPMSSMTRQECTQLSVLLPRYFIVTPEHLSCLEHINGGIINFEVLDTIIDFYNSHHLDWRGLIPKGLALEAPKDMYNIK